MLGARPSAAIKMTKFKSLIYETYKYSSERVHYCICEPPRNDTTWWTGGVDLGANQSSIKSYIKTYKCACKNASAYQHIKENIGCAPFRETANLQSLTGNRFHWVQSLRTPYSYHGISWSPHFTSNSTVQRQNKMEKNQSSHHLSFVRGIHRWPHMFRWNQIAQLEIQLDSIKKMLSNIVNVN